MDLRNSNAIEFKKNRIEALSKISSELEKCII